jgi:hypothetical protein
MASAGQNRPRALRSRASVQVYIPSEWNRVPESPVVVAPSSIIVDIDSGRPQTICHNKDLTIPCELLSRPVVPCFQKKKLGTSTSESAAQSLSRSFVIGCAVMCFMSMELPDPALPVIQKIGSPRSSHFRKFGAGDENFTLFLLSELLLSPTRSSLLEG